LTRLEWLSCRHGVSPDDLRRWLRREIEARTGEPFDVWERIERRHDGLTVSRAAETALIVVGLPHRPSGSDDTVAVGELDQDRVHAATGEDATTFALSLGQL
jgi:hypothetical protein